MRLIRQLVCLFAMAILAILSAHADDWSAPAAEMARRIVAKAGPGSAITFAVRNSSSLTAAEVSAITKRIESQLRAQQMQLVQPSQAVANVVVTLSENVECYLWLAEVQQGNATDIIMTAVPRPSSAAMHSAPPMALRRNLLVVQDEPILDVALRPDSATVLSRSALTWYGIQGTKWQELQSRPIIHSRPFPRDLRGRLWNNALGVAGASLPGLRCTQASVSDTSLTCTEADDPWPMYSGMSIIMEAFFSPVRNFFSGTIAFHDDTPKDEPRPLSYSLPPFYSMATVVENGLPLWLFAGVDGRVTFFGGKTGTTPATTMIRGWGSDITSIASSCQPDERFVLASRAGDLSRPDTVEAYRIVDREPVSVVAAIDFAGPITALWTSSVDNGSAIAVSHNLQTGKYEAYTLSLACNQ